MTAAVVLAHPWGHLEAAQRLLTQLGRWGITDVTLVGTESSVAAWRGADAWTTVLVHPDAPGADLLALTDALTPQGGGNSDVVVLWSGQVISDSPLGDVLQDPRISSGVVVRPTVGRHPDPAGSIAADAAATVRRAGAAVVSAGSAMHTVTDPDAAVVGPLRVAGDARATTATALRQMAATARSRDWPKDPQQMMAVAMVRSGVAVTAVDAGPFVSAVAQSPADFDRLVAVADGLDEDTLRRKGSARPGDGFYSTFVVRKLSQPVTALALRLGFAPNPVTVLSFIVGLASAWTFSRGSLGYTVAGALLLQLSLILDCTDGEIARYTRGYTPLGAWLDAVSDRFKEYLVYAGLAVGAINAGADADLAWTLAAATLALQVFRHTVDFGFAVRQGERTAAAATPVRVPLDQPDDQQHVVDVGRAASASGIASLGQGAKDLSELTNQTQALVWAKRAIIMPIGERWLVISVVSVVAGGIAVFVALLALGAVAASYTTLGRVLRSVADA